MGGIVDVAYASSGLLRQRQLTLRPGVRQQAAGTIREEPCPSHIGAGMHVSYP